MNRQRFPYILHITFEMKCNTDVLRILKREFSRAFPSTSPELLTCSIPINQSTSSMNRQKCPYILYITFKLKCNTDVLRMLK